MDQADGKAVSKRKIPPNTYWRGPVIWGRIKIAGREYRDSLRTSDPREAARRVKAWRLKLERAAVGDPDSPSFKAAVVRWASEILPGAVKPAVAKRYLVSIGQLEATFGDMRIDQITPVTISDYIGKRSQIATNATIRRDLTALSRLLAACVAWGWRQDNPARFYDRSIIRERRDPISPPRREEIDAVINAAPEGMAAILRLLEQTGMRENEAVTLEARDVDWNAHKITLTRTKTSRPRTLDWRTPGGDAGTVLETLEGTGPLFLTEGGQPYRNFSSNFGQLMRRLEVRRFRVHDLRHAFAIRWLRNGGDIYELSHHLGHTSVKTTEVYLGHISSRRLVAQKGAQRDVDSPFHIASNRDEC
jgi:integrase